MAWPIRSARSRPACRRTSVNLVSHEHVDLPFHNDPEVGVVEHLFHEDAHATIEEFRAELWSATSYKALREDALDVERTNRLHPSQPVSVPYVTTALAESEGPIVAVTDFMKAVPDMVARWVPCSFTALGTDGYGRSDTRAALRRHFERLPDEFPDPNERLRMMSELILPLYSCELATTDQEIEMYDARAYEEAWTDMVRLQNQGVYPTAFAPIHAPVLMLHGRFDPHPGRMILASLKPHIQQLEYVEFESCGHYPWLEKAARDEFFSVLRGWLSRMLLDSGRSAQK